MPLRTSAWLVVRCWSAKQLAILLVLGAGLWGLEDLANLSAMINHTYYLVAGVPRYQEGSGGPARVLALLEGMM